MVDQGKRNSYQGAQEIQVGDVHGIAAHHVVMKAFIK